MSPAIFAERLAEIKNKIQAAGGRDVQIVGAVKGQGISVLEESLRSGLRDFGGSYVNELLQQNAELKEAAGQVNWHFIGQLQSNKVKSLKTTGIKLFQSLDRESLLRSLAKHIPGAEILLQLDTTGNPDRGGASLEEIPALLDLSRELGLRPEGIMVINRQDPDSAIQDTKTAYGLKERLGLRLLSAGMSNDYEVAVGQGANMIRLGSALFSAGQ